MAEQNIAHLAVARAYSQALMNLAVERDEVERIRLELKELAAHAAINPDFQSFLTDPALDQDARRASIEKLFRNRLSDVLVDTMQVLNRKARLNLFEAFAETYRVLWERNTNRIDVHVTSAVPLSAELRSRIIEVTGKVIGMQPELVEHVDEAILGGLILQAGDHKFDASAASMLKRLGIGLIERAEAELHSERSYVTA
jgi:F-type H+-transporting ATPase subunit delta